MSTKSNSQWKVLLEERVEYRWPSLLQGAPTNALLQQATFDAENKEIVISILQQTGKYARKNKLLNLINIAIL